MDAKTLEALKGSIAKWEAITAGTEADLMADNCSLCQAFPCCMGCPVAEKVEVDGCNKTPWVKWHRAMSDRDISDRKADTPKLVDLAQAELDFLRSLLPTEVA